MRGMNFFNLPNPSSCTRPWSFSASKRNEYQKQKNNVFGESDQSVGLTTLPPFVNQLSKQCGMLNICEPYRLAWPALGIAFYFLLLCGITTQTEVTALRTSDLTRFVLTFNVVQTKRYERCQTKGTRNYEIGRKLPRYNGSV
jgi:hypothetical protein